MLSPRPWKNQIHGTNQCKHAPLREDCSTSLTRVLSSRSQSHSQTRAPQREPLKQCTRHICASVQVAAHQPFLSKKNYAYWVGRVAYWDVHERDRQRCVPKKRQCLDWLPYAVHASWTTRSVILPIAARLLLHMSLDLATTVFLVPWTLHLCLFCAQLGAARVRTAASPGWWSACWFDVHQRQWRRGDDGALSACGFRRPCGELCPLPSHGWSDD